MEADLLLCLVIFMVAALYSTVGHGGGSGYIAAMTAFGLAVNTIRPAALLLNILVTSYITWKYWRRGLVKGRNLLVLAGASVPCAFIGGGITLDFSLYKKVIGVLLLISAFSLIFSEFRKKKPYPTPNRVPLAGGLAAGGAIGFVSGLSGIGGGVLLSPLLILGHWVGVKEASGLAAAFILANSTSGLLGNVASVGHITPDVIPYLLAAGLGALAGGRLGLEVLSRRYILLFLAAALLVAGVKYIFI